jgi:hypothetical protein
MTDMTDTSPNLGLPFYQTKLNEFEVQHNEALLMLDALVMLAVIDRDLSAPPVSPALGDRYLVKATGTGDFAGNDNRVAQYDTGGWNFYAPKAGWTCYVQDESVLLAWDGASWAPALDVMGAVTELNNLSLLGIGTAADSVNPLSAKLNNVLWAARTISEGGDGTLRYKMSKEDASKTLSLLFQNNFEGRAEVGLTGDDDFRVKVSADGATWQDAIVIDRTTGAVSLPNTDADSGGADLDITLAELALGLADALNVAQFLGASGNRFADSFDMLAYVDTSAATNLDTGTAGQLKPTETAGSAISGATGTAIGDLTGGGGLSAAFDGSTSQAGSGVSAGKDAATQAYIGKNYTSAPKKIGKAIVYGSNNTGFTSGAGAATVTISLRGKNGSAPTPYTGDGTEIGTLAFSDTANESGGRTVTSADTSTSWDYVWIEIAQSGSATTMYVAEAVFYVAATTDNLTVTSTSLTASAAPASMKIVAQVEEPDAITLNTHLIFSVSRDGGTTWADATMSDRFSSGSIHVLESAEIDVSAQPSATDVKWKITTTSGKAVKVHGICIYWT